MTGIGVLENKIKDIIFKGKVPAADFVSVSNDRQLSILRRTIEDVNNGIEAFKNKISADCIAIYVRSSIEGLGEITGHTITEQALDRIFSEFCIGK